MLKTPFFGLPKDSIIHGHRPDFMLPFTIFCRKNPKVCTLHGIPEINIKKRKNVMIWRIYTFIEKYSLSHIDKLIAVNRSAKEYYSKKKRNLDDKTVVIPVGIDSKRFKPLDKEKIREKYGFKQEETIILYIGRFSIEKDLELLLKAFKALRSEIPKARLILLGKGPEEERLKKIVKTQHIDGVTFMKPVCEEHLGFPRKVDKIALKEIFNAK